MEKDKGTMARGSRIRASKNSALIFLIFTNF
jgi:hypothetical protein